MHEDKNTGIVLLHGALDPDTLNPLASCKALSGYRVLSYRRKAYRAGNARLPVAVREDADDCVDGIDQQNLGRVHLIGHSHGALVALDFARKYPNRTGSLILIEAGVSAHVPSAALAAPYVIPAITLYEKGFRVEALKCLTEIIYGESDTLCASHTDDELLRFAQATFESDLPAQAAWALPGPNELSATPVLSLIGGASDEHFKQRVGFPLIGEVAELVRQMIPHAVQREISGGTHSLPATHADQAGAVIADFIER